MNLLLRTLGDAPIIVGHSLGATVALLSDAPARGLILFDPIFAPKSIRLRSGRNDPHYPQARMMAIGALRRQRRFVDLAEARSSLSVQRPFSEAAPAVLEGFMASGLKPAPDGGLELCCTSAWEASNARATAYDPPRALAAKTVPVWIIRSDKGSTCYPGSGRWVERLGKATTLRTQRDSTHFDALANPDWAAHIVLAMHRAQTLDQALALGQGLRQARGSGRSGDIEV